MSRWNQRDDVPRGDDFDARWRRLEEAGESIHGEADLIEALWHESFPVEPTGRILDAGCGTGRVAIELHRRGFDVVGVDLDDAMLATARAKAPGLEWMLADIADVRIERDGSVQLFDIVALPGNVMIFVDPGSEAQVIENLAAHLVPNGLLVAGFRLQPGRLDLEAYDDHCADAGLQLAYRWSTWHREPFRSGGDYAVSVHRRES